VKRNCTQSSHIERFAMGVVAVMGWIFIGLAAIFVFFMVVATIAGIAFVCIAWPLATVLSLLVSRSIYDVTFFVIGIGMTVVGAGVFVWRELTDS
jgi:hypothetical protein